MSMAALSSGDLPMMSVVAQISKEGEKVLEIGK